MALSFYNGTTTECVTLSTDWTVTVWNLKAQKVIKKMVIGSEATRKVALGPISVAEFACGSHGKGQFSFNLSDLPYISFPEDTVPSSLAFTRTSAQLIWIGWWRSHGLLGGCSVDTGKRLPMLHVAGSFRSTLHVLEISNNIAIADSDDQRY